jgi:hypothetical protein
VFQRISKISKPLRTAVFLISVYGLHVIFLQLLMTSHPTHEFNNDIKPLFSNHCKKHCTPAAHHPAVSYYTQLIKAGNPDGRVVCEAPPVECHVITLEVPAVLAYSSRYSSTSNETFPPGDNSVKRYLLLRIFLV